MKRKILFLTIFSILTTLLFVVACNKELDGTKVTDSKITPSETSTYYTRSQLQSLSLAQIRTIYSSITPQNRYDLTIDKLNHVLTCNITSAQASIINSFKSYLTVNVFNWGSTEHIHLKTTFLPSKTTLLQANFTNSEGLNTFYHLYDLDPNNFGNSFFNDMDNDPEQCDCNRGAFFGACQFFGDFCTDDTCLETSSSCGFFGAYECDGVCKQTQSGTTGSTGGGSQTTSGNPQLFN